jgi:HSP20 family molecular chaperone IbpA
MGNLARYKPQQLATRPGLLGHNIIDTFFNDFMNPEYFQTSLNKTVSGYPVADIYHNDDGSTVLEFALAGFSKDDLQIDVQPEKRTITVSANSNTSEDRSTRRIARRSFEKTYVNYDDNLDLTQAEATYENGLLTVIVPKRPETEPMRIAIT